MCVFVYEWTYTHGSLDWACLCLNVVYYSNELKLGDCRQFACVSGLLYLCLCVYLGRVLCDNFMASVNIMISYVSHTHTCKHSHMQSVCDRIECVGSNASEQIMCDDCFCESENMTARRLWHSLRACERRYRAYNMLVGVRVNKNDTKKT